MVFKKGESGTPENIIKKGEVRNPNGRPKGSKNWKTIIREIGQVTLEGKDIKDEKRQMSAREIAISAMFKKAMKGDLNAAKMLIEFDEGKAVQTNENIDITPVIEISKDDSEL